MNNNKIKTRQEFRKKFPVMYKWLLRNNPTLLDKYLPCVNKSWTKEECKEDALKYSTRSEWVKNSQSAYQTAHRNGWLDYCSEHMEKLRKSWTKETCKEDALKYSTRSEWKKNSSGAYHAAREKGWLDYCCEHMTDRIKPAGFWTKETCKEDALKYSTRMEWSKNSSGAYKAAHRNEWMDSCCEHMTDRIKPAGFWTKEECKKDALKYATKSEWKKNSSSAWAAAHRNGWLDECCKHMMEGKKKNGFWTKDVCKKDALKYNTRKEWQKNSGSAFNAAWKNKWLDYCCSHMG